MTESQKDKIIGKIKDRMVAKTIEKIEFRSIQAPNDTLILYFTDATSIKIVSDPNCCFEGLSFYVPKVVERIEYEEINEEIK